MERETVVLSEAGVPHDDLSYTGESSTSPLSMDYYRQKYQEFQVTLNALDDSYRTGLALYWLPQTAESAAGLDALLTEYESKRDTLRATAEALNMGAAIVNSMGGRMPQLSIPGTLGLAPALPIAAVIAVSTAVTLIVWGQEFTRRLFHYLTNSLVLDSAATPEQRQELAAGIVKAEQAVAIAESSSMGAFGGVANIVKWGAIALGAWLAYRALAPRLQGRSKNPPTDDESDFVTGDDGDDEDAAPGDE